LTEHRRRLLENARLAELFIDEVNCSVEEEEEEEEEERFCFNVWIWTDAPNDLALEGKLQVEEPVVHPDDDDSLYHMGDMDIPAIRDEPAATLDYKVLMHLDRCWTTHLRLSVRTDIASKRATLAASRPAVLAAAPLAVVDLSFEVDQLELADTVLGPGGQLGHAESNGLEVEDVGRRDGQVFDLGSHRRKGPQESG
jgi:hypothetical protein